MVSDTEVTADSLPGTGVVDVTLTSTSGMSVASPPGDQFTYGPTVSSVSPRSGPIAGGTQYHHGHQPGQCHGRRLRLDAGDRHHQRICQPAHRAEPAGRQPRPCRRDSDQYLAATSPTSADDVFTYTATGATAPAVTGISPIGGRRRHLRDHSRVRVQPAVTGVYFGPTAAENFSDVNDSTITAVSPAGMGVVNVFCDHAGRELATSAADQFSYLPTVTGVSPRSGTITGGTLVIITGTNLSGATGVLFGTARRTAGVAFRLPRSRSRARRARSLGPWM